MVEAEEGGEGGDVAAVDREGGELADAAEDQEGGEEEGGEREGEGEAGEDTDTEEGL